MLLEQCCYTSASLRNVEVSPWNVSLAKASVSETSEAKCIWLTYSPLLFWIQITFAQCLDSYSRNPTYLMYSTLHKIYCRCEMKYMLSLYLCTMNFRTLCISSAKRIFLSFCTSPVTTEMVSGMVCLANASLIWELGEKRGVWHTSLAAEKAGVHFQHQCQCSSLSNNNLKANV